MTPRHLFLALLTAGCANPLCESSAPAIEPPALPDGRAGDPYAVTLRVDGLLDGEVRWSIDALPPGLALDERTGVLSGTPSAAGQVELTVTATPTPRDPECALAPASGDYVLTVAEAEACDAALPSWDSGGDLPEGRESSGVLLHGDSLYVAGGWNGRGVTDSVLVAAVADDGSVGPWRSAPALPSAVERPAAVAHGQHLYLLGGDLGTPEPTGQILIGEIDADGHLTGWIAAAEGLPEPRVGHSGFALGGRVYVVGGMAGASPTTSVISGVPGPDGVTDWRDEAALPFPVMFMSSSVVGERAYVAAGDGERTIVLTAERRGERLGEWRPQPDIPGGLMAVEIHANERGLFVTGGLDLTMAGSSVARFAPVAADGSLGEYVDVADLPEPRFGHRMVARTDQLYLVGGWSTLSAAPRATVLTARICR